MIIPVVPSRPGTQSENRTCLRGQKESIHDQRTPEQADQTVRKIRHEDLHGEGIVRRIRRWSRLRGKDTGLKEHPPASRKLHQQTVTSVSFPWLSPVFIRSIPLQSYEGSGSVDANLSLAL